MSLLDTYNQMVQEANQEHEKVAEEQGEQEQVDERMQILQKYASVADEALAEEYGEGNYTEEDVEEVATALLEKDAEEQLQREKVAEFYEAGKIMYAGFRDAAEADSE